MPTWDVSDEPASPFSGKTLKAAFSFVDKLTHERAVLQWLKFAATNTRPETPSKQKSLIEETIDIDISLRTPRLIGA